MIRSLKRLRHVLLTLFLLIGSVAFLYMLHPSPSSAILLALVAILVAFLAYSGIQKTVKPQARSKKIRHSCIRWSLVAMGLFGFSYSLVPMYHLMCHGMGMHGQSMASGASHSLKPRMLTVHFLNNQYGQSPVKIIFSDQLVILKQKERKKIVMMLINESDQQQDVAFKTSMTEGLSSCLIMNLPVKKLSLKPLEAWSALVDIERNDHCPSLAQGAWGVYVFDTKNIGIEGKNNKWKKMIQPYQPVKS